MSYCCLKTNFDISQAALLFYFFTCRLGSIFYLLYGCLGDVYLPRKKHTHHINQKSAHKKLQNITQRQCTLECLWKQENNDEIRTLTKTRKQLPMTFIYQHFQTVWLLLSFCFVLVTVNPYNQTSLWITIKTMLLILHFHQKLNFP